MKSILISIKPEWVCKILNGEKTIEIRKTIPKCELPIDVYIYCTKRLPYLYYDNEAFLDYNKDQFKAFKGLELNGKVVAKFKLNNVEKIYPYYDYNWGQVDYDCESNTDLCGKSCMNNRSIANYLNDNGGYDKDGYAWHINDLEIFDEPINISEFKTKAPQSWCYVEVKE